MSSIVPTTDCIEPARRESMDALPATWTALCAVAFLLGSKHGFDADHLATIDGLTRYNARANPRLARARGPRDASRAGCRHAVGGVANTGLARGHGRNGLGLLPVRTCVHQR